MQTVKKYLFIGLMAVVAVASLNMPAAHAQGAAAVTIPFNFSVGSSQYEAGDYRLHTEGSANSFLALAKTGGDTKLSMLLPGVNDEANRGPYLVFHRYGTEAFLIKVVFSPAETYNLPRSAREKVIVAVAARICLQQTTFLRQQPFVRLHPSIGDDWTFQAERHRLIELQLMQIVLCHLLKFPQFRQLNRTRRARM